MSDLLLIELNKQIVILKDKIQSLEDEKHLTQLTKDEIRQQFELCNKGLAINLLYDSADEFYLETYTNSLWISFLECAEINGMLKEG